MTELDSMDGAFPSRLHSKNTYEGGSGSYHPGYEREDSAGLGETRDSLDNLAVSASDRQPLPRSKRAAFVSSSVRERASAFWVSRDI